MKRIISVFAIVMLIFILIPFDCFVELTGMIHAESAAVFPSSLQIIEEDSFAETGLSVVVFQSGLQRIGERAFQGVSSLTDVYLPESIVFIADSAFLKNDGLAVHGISGSYAQAWAEKQQIRFIKDDIWIAEQNRNEIHIEKLIMLFWIALPADEKTIQSLFRPVYYIYKSRRPQDRPELHPIDYRFP